MISPPSAAISGKPKVCVGDTTTYTNFFINNTFYSWSTTCGTIIDTSNNQIRIVWDTIGLCKVTVSAINMCGSNSGTKTVHIFSYQQFKLEAIQLFARETQFLFTQVELTIIYGHPPII